MTIPLIEFRNVTVFGREGNPILKNISFTVDAGEKVLIFGPSGSGKSTILFTLMGRHRPASGEVLFNNRPLTPKLAKSLRTQITYIPQTAAPGAESVKESLLLPFSFAANRDLTPSREKIEQVLTAVNLRGEILNRKTSALSGGEKQRLAIARALLLERDLFLIDEPASALDEKNESDLLRLLLRMEKTLVVITHNSGWKRSFDKVLEIENGERANLYERRGDGG
ncbi:ABC transporter ATP-binding protein [Chitinispirillum alkaliphilum]|nr:ABC transporter ATP-binding protein [Chitinispirillum alkaliphilum]